MIEQRAHPFSTGGQAAGAVAKGGRRVVKAMVFACTWRQATIRSVAFLAAAVSVTLTHGAIDFNRDIRPILSENCYFCHGPDKNHRQADLRLDDRDTAIEMGAIVPGDAEGSGLINRIHSDDAKEQMPPPDSRKHLNDEQKKLLRQWIDEGAVYKRHWSYEPPVKPETQEGHHPIDDLVRRQLAARGIQPSAEADRRTLGRRLFFDLIGLPPTPEQIDEFVNDPSSDAYEQLVERLLASPHFGERMAMGWLDAVRFADTIGYHSDNPHEVWPYRDYVIRSFNENKRFDQFTIEQLAGDLLPESTQDQKVASCFNRLLMTTGEGGAQAKDYEARMLTDRVRAMGAVWLGQTLGCCQCHDHKFDPMTTRDFYSMGAFFADIDEPIIDLREPGMLLPSAEQAQELARLRMEATELRKQYDAMPPRLAAAELAWEKSVLAEAVEADRWQVLKPTEVSATRGTKLSADKDGTISVDVNTAQDIDTFVLNVKTSLKGITGLRLDVLPNNDFPRQGPGLATDGSFTLSEFEATDANGGLLSLAHASATWEASGSSADYAIDANADGNRGWSADVPAAGQAICFELSNPVGGDQETAITIRLHQNKGNRRLIGRFQLSATTSAKPVRAPQAIVPPQDIVELVRTEPEKRKPDQQAILNAHFKLQLAELADLRGRVFAAEKAVTEFEAKLPRCLVSKSLATPRTVRILPRGNWMDESGPVVEPAIPHYLPQPNADGERRWTRLDLARWVVSRENPLTARVFINRLWKQFFGIGLSKTLDDLGSQGEWPVHPELLDWLACEFMDSGWDVKHMIRVIVTSQTYRQASTASPELLADDPDNRLLARQIRFRLDAELVRDNALAVSGLLVPTIGGPSVKPYQPEGYWENLNFPVRTYEEDHGPNQHRRGLYTWWQRTYLHPSLLAFDAPSREECAAERSRSNIPQQALVLLNDPTYVEAARAFAARMVQEGGADPQSRIGWAWRRALGRPPRDDEASTAAAVFEKHRAEYAANPDAAKELLKVGEAPMPEKADPVELAAWTSVARIVLNLHETITRN